MDIRLAVVRDASGLATLQSEWNPLLNSSRSNNLFLTWEWVSTWWNVYGAGSRLHILTARDSQGRLVGIAPLKRTTRGVRGVWTFDVFEFIGQGGDVTPEYLDFIITRECEETVLDAMIAALREDYSSDGIDLRPFAAASPNLARARQRLGAGPGRLRCDPDSVCPVLELPDSVGAFMATRSKNYRKKIRESERRCERELQARLKKTTTADELRQDFEVLIDLHQKRWSGTSRAFRTAKYILFHDQLGALLLERGWMRLFTLHTGRPLAVLYCFAYDGRYYYYQAGRDPEFTKHRVGLVLMHKVIQEAIKENATVFDFLRGEETYKYHWANGAARNVRLQYSRSIALRALNGMNGLLGRSMAVTDTSRP